MKALISFIVVGVFMSSAFGADNATQSRRSIAANFAAAPRAVASKNQIAVSAVSVSGGTNNSVPLDQANGNKSSLRVDGDAGATTPTPPEEKPQDPVKDMREKERAACLANNIGIGNTFVWASKYSNISNYGTMIEDVEHPENNVCFVKVELRSDDMKVSVSDIPGKYFEFGQTITCGSWVDKEMLKKRILDAKKSARTWGTVAGVVGGAGIGVGMMELFGNRLIGGAVEGQKGLERNGKTDELLRSQLAVLRKDDQRTYNQFIDKLKLVKQYCDNTDWAQTTHGVRPKDCDVYDYDYILGIANTGK